MWEGDMKKSASTLSLLALTAILAFQLPGVAVAGQAEEMREAMEILKSKAATLEEPSLKDEDKAADKAVPALYFGNTDIDGNYALVDEIQQKTGANATFFVKSGEDFVRVATNVKKDDGSRAIGTVLDPKGKAMAAVVKDESYFGEASILGKPYLTGYEPIHDAKHKVIGIYFVGFAKSP
jgi:hypothetical protein